MSRCARNTILLLALSGAAFVGTSAVAQTRPAPEAEESADVPEIIVSARRRSETLQSTPVAITALPASQIEARGAVTIADLQGAAPNVLITRQTTGTQAANISIRGISFADVDPSFDPAVGVNVDGVYIGISSGQLLDFFDIDSIEILRGPQGTLFGRNTIGGVINVNRSRPTGKWGGKFELSLASYGTFGAKAVVNVPVVKDLLAMKVFGFHNDTDGYYRDGYTGQHRGGGHNENVGVSLLLTPSPNFDALLTLEKQYVDVKPILSSISRTGDIFCLFALAGECDRNTTTDLYTTFGGPGFQKSTTPAATLEMNLDTGPVKLTSITSYRKNTENLFLDSDAIAADLYAFALVQNYHQFSQELRASGNIGDKFDYVAGLYHFESGYNYLQHTTLFGVALPVPQDTTGKSRSDAIFVDLNWKIFDRVRLSGGGRFTHDRKDNINPTLVNPTDGSVGISAHHSWSKFTPKVALDWRPTDDLMLYTSWSRGYRSGGYNGRGQTYFSSTTPYNPETVDAYEVGLKSEFLDHKVALNLAAFYTDYKSIQQSSTVTLAGGVGNETIVTNAGGARIKGFEADITARPVNNLTIRGAFGYTDAQFRDFIVNQLAFGALRTFDFSKVDLIYAPKVTAAINADYEVPIGRNQMIFNVSYRYLSRYDQQIAADPATAIPATGTIVVQNNDPRLRSDAQNMLDASVSLVFDMNGAGAKSRITVFARNLLDDRGPATAFDVAAFPTLWSFATAREPRVFGVQLGLQF